MKIALAVTAFLIGLIGLHLTQAGILVWQSRVENLGEGGPAFGCFYLTTRGPVRVGYFFEEQDGQSNKEPHGRSDCRWSCFITKDVYALGNRRVTASRCASDG
jgi:hypothetical protein